MKMQTRLVMLNKTEVIKTYLRNDIPFGMSLFDATELNDEEKAQLKSGATLMHKPSMIEHFNGITEKVVKKLPKGALKDAKVIIASNTTINEDVENPFKTGDKVLYDGKPTEVIRAYVYKGKPYCILDGKKQVSATKLSLNKSKTK